MYFYGARGGAPESIKIIKILVEISIEASKALKIFMNFDYFLFKNLILIKVTLGGYWKSLIILTEINKPSGKSLRVWAKNQLRF